MRLLLLRLREFCLIVGSALVLVFRGEGFESVDDRSSEFQSSESESSHA